MHVLLQADTFWREGASCCTRTTLPFVFIAEVRWQLTLHDHALLHDTHTHMHTHTYTGSYFGEISMIAFAERIMNADAITSCQLYVT